MNKDLVSVAIKEAEEFVNELFEEDAYLDRHKEQEIHDYFNMIVWKTALQGADILAVADALSEKYPEYNCKLV